jgi:hypothetical protein
MAWLFLNAENAEEKRGPQRKKAALLSSLRHLCALCVSFGDASFDE